MIKGPQQSGRKAGIMPRNKGNNSDVETVEETEEVATPEASAEGTETKAKGPKRGELPEGYVTPVGLAKVLGERGLQTNRAGEVLEKVAPQMVYSYINNAPKDDPFPTETVTDSNGNERNAVRLEAAIEWWERKNERTKTRRENAAKKAEAKERKAAEKAQAEEAEASEGPVEEAE